MKEWMNERKWIKERTKEWMKEWMKVWTKKKQKKKDGVVLIVNCQLWIAKI